MLEKLELIISQAQIENVSDKQWSRSAIYKLHNHLNINYKLINFLNYWLNNSILEINDELKLNIHILEDHDITLSNDTYLALEFHFYNQEHDDNVIVRYIW